MTLGERLLEYRTNLKMSQDTLAERVGVTRQTVSKWETDQSTPEFNKILPLCEVFGITTGELIKGEKEEVTIKNEKSDEAFLYNLKRSKKKAMFLSVSVFLYIVGVFVIPYMVEVQEVTGGEAVMVARNIMGYCNSVSYIFLCSISKKKGKGKGKWRIKL